MNENFFAKSGLVSLFLLSICNVMQKIIKIVRAVFEMSRSLPSRNFITNYGTDFIGPCRLKVGGPKSEKTNGGKYENFCYR